MSKGLEAESKRIYVHNLCSRKQVKEMSSETNVCFRRSLELESRRRGKRRLRQEEKQNFRCRKAREKRPLFVKARCQAFQANIEVDSDEVQEFLDSHNQELTIDELMEIHEIKQDTEELEFLPSSIRRSHEVREFDRMPQFN
ncbi:hypothetical protein TNCV_2586681 [Trichonephila clavipes]|nr:hypothetical protein TNCV_2586681 [Trichonephila clavipes]